MITYAGSTLIAKFFCGKIENGNAVYIGLSKTTPNVSGGNLSEPTATTYSRVQLSDATQYNYVDFFGEPTQGENGTVNISNDKIIYFPETYNQATSVGEDWGVCTHVCLFSAKTGGNLLAYQELNAPIHPGEGSVSSIPIIRVGDITLSFGNPE